jgi:hypothetical protein
LSIRPSLRTSASSAPLRLNVCFYRRDAEDAEVRRDGTLAAVLDAEGAHAAVEMAAIDAHELRRA